MAAWRLSSLRRLLRKIREAVHLRYELLLPVFSEPGCLEPKARVSAPGRDRIRHVLILTGIKRPDLPARVFRSFVVTSKRQP